MVTPLNSLIEHHLCQLDDVLSAISDEDYHHFDREYNASIGQHVRHGLEIFTLLLIQYDSGIINYEKRERDLSLEADTTQARNTVNQLLSQFIKPEKLLTLEAEGHSISTTYSRELLYQLEHIVHHNAIIKPMLKRYIKLDETFGYAPSTIRHLHHA